MQRNLSSESLLEDSGLGIEREHWNCLLQAERDRQSGRELAEWTGQDTDCQHPPFLCRPPLRRICNDFFKRLAVSAWKGGSGPRANHSPLLFPESEVSHSTLQAEIIDDLAQLVDKTDSRIKNETHRVKLLDTKSASCGMQLVIVLLLIAIIVVAVW
ncbi:hypothetical protein cypCar_00019431 [Cyprinus carpio]|nr:hypothetical protein cypCar_00019431 [Cyprinus carpio]